MCLFYFGFNLRRHVEYLKNVVRFSFMETYIHYCARIAYLV